MASPYQQALDIVTNIRDLDKDHTARATPDTKEEKMNQAWIDLLLAVEAHCTVGEKVTENYNKSEKNLEKSIKESDKACNQRAEKKRIRKAHLRRISILSENITKSRQETQTSPKLATDEATQIFNRVSLSHDLLLANIELAKMDREYGKAERHVEASTERVKRADEECISLLARLRKLSEEMGHLEAEIRAVAPLVGVEVPSLE
ncbi:hypothetical protein P7C71_g1978, partial [Lecanoromycetidae sp. Uapishka_2]